MSYNRTELFTVCDRCGVALTNNDFTSFDMNDMSDDDWTSVYASVDAMGLAVRTDETIDGYGDCFVCSETVVDPTIWRNDEQR